MNHLLHSIVNEEMRAIAHVIFFSVRTFLFCRALGGYQSSASAFEIETADCQRTFRLILKNTEDAIEDSSDQYL